MTKAQKAEYDRRYRERNRDRIRAAKAAYFQRTYDPHKAAIERKKTMPRHVEYCRRPEYRAKKRQYDKERRAKQFGEFGPAYAALQALLKEIRTQMPDREKRYAQSGRHQWNPANHAKRREKRALDKFNIDCL